MAGFQLKSRQLTEVSLTVEDWRCILDVTTAAIEAGERESRTMSELSPLRHVRELADIALGDADDGRDFLSRRYVELLSQESDGGRRVRNVDGGMPSRVPRSPAPPGKKWKFDVFGGERLVDA